MSAPLVIGAVAIAVGSNEAKKLSTGKGVTVEPVIGGFILGLFLFAITAFNEGLGNKFCYLVIAAAALTNGAATLQTLSKLANPTPLPIVPKVASQSSSTGGSTGKGYSGGGGGGGGGGGV